MPSHPIVEKGPDAGSVILMPAPEADLETRRSDLEETKQQIVCDLHRDRQMLRAVSIPELAIMLALALVLAIIASVGLVVTIVGFGSGMPASELADIMKVLVTGASSLVTAGVVVLLTRFHRTARIWLREEQRGTRVINLIRMGDNVENLRRVLEDYGEAEEGDEQYPATPESGADENQPGGTRG